MGRGDALQGPLQRCQEVFVHVMSQLLARLGSHLTRAAKVNAAPHAGIDDRIDGILERWKDEASACIRRDNGVRELSASEEVHEGGEGRAADLRVTGRIFLVR